MPVTAPSRADVEKVEAMAVSQAALDPETMAALMALSNEFMAAFRARLAEEAKQWHLTTQDNRLVAVRDDGFGLVAPLTGMESLEEGEEILFLFLKTPPVKGEPAGGEGYYAVRVKAARGDLEKRIVEPEARLPVEVQQMLPDYGVPHLETLSVLLPYGLGPDPNLVIDIQLISSGLP
jgi:hypothetical protein